MTISGIIAGGILIAEAAPPDPGAPSSGGGGGFGLFLPLILMFVVMYLLLIRPQKRRETERQAMLGQLKAKDHVVTIGGIQGKVVSIKDNEIVLLIDARKDVQIKVTRASISHVQGSEGGDVTIQQLDAPK